jgi:hypothetical protein
MPRCRVVAGRADGRQGVVRLAAHHRIDRANSAAATGQFRKIGVT